MTNSLETDSDDVQLRSPNEVEVFKLFEQVFQQYAVNQTILSFNGGKDCTVVLHMLSEYLDQRQDECEMPLQVLYIQGDDAFEEIEQFVQRCTEDYKMTLIQRRGNIKAVLKDICDEMPELQAVFMGTRRTDPFCENLNIIHKTDPGWPALMRVSPLLEWSCSDVWQYIFEHQISYCPLYDQGYTSLGNRRNTKPNPHLQMLDPKTGIISYRAAYELDDDRLERAGRE